MNKNKWLVPVLCIGIVLCMAVTIWALFFRKPAVVLTPDYAPVETEAHAETIPNDVSEKAEAPQGGGSISIQYSLSKALTHLSQQLRLRKGVETIS